MMPTPHAHRFRLIVAAIDFSTQSARALRYAAATARAAGGRVVALHALDPLLSAAAARAYAERVLMTETREELSRFVSKILGPDDAEAVECVVTIGPARQVLIQESGRRHADVVVMGTNGRGGVSKLFFGSTTESLLRRYHGAVMVVPPRAPMPEATWPGGRLLAAIPAGPHRQAMASAAARTAEVFGAWLTLDVAAEESFRTPRQSAPLVVLPLPDAARLRTFRQGTAAYEFVRRARVPVLVMHTGRRIGHVTTSRRAA